MKGEEDSSMEDILEREEDMEEEDCTCSMECVHASVQWGSHAWFLLMRRISRGKKPLPPEPTEFLPGTEGKVAVLEERARMGYHLWHPLDRLSDLE